MEKHLFKALCCIWLVCGSANAEVITHEFTATLISNDGPSEPGDIIDQITQFGVITGSIVYETDTPDLSSSLDVGFYEDSVLISVDQTTLPGLIEPGGPSPASVSWLEIEYPVASILFANTFSTSPIFQGVRIDFMDAPWMVFMTDAMPTSLNLADFVDVPVTFSSGSNRAVYRVISLSNLIIDTDGDLVSDVIDNCQLVANEDQRDTNGDGFGNICDPDLNNDGVVNFIDITLFAEEFNTANNGDSDLNGDGAINFADLSIVSQYFLMPPGPSGNVP